MLASSEWALYGAALTAVGEARCDVGRKQAWASAPVRSMVATVAMLFGGE